MLVTRSNYAIGLPKDEDDVLRYVHPSTGMYDVEQYKKMEPFADHGAPCVFNMLDAEKKNLIVDYYPIDRYVAHLSGASWCVPKPIWPHGFNVRPVYFMTIIPYGTEQMYESLYCQKYQWFDIVFEGVYVKEHIIMHQFGERNVGNSNYQNRMLVNGEYVCEINECVSATFEEKFINYIIENGAVDELEIDNIKIVKRNKWQQENALR